MARDKTRTRDLWEEAVVDGEELGPGEDQRTHRNQ